MRDHTPVVLDSFNGLWARGDIDTTPLDHFSECNNVDSYGDSGFKTRDGVEFYQEIVLPLADVKRIYNYPTPTGNGLIVLTWDGTTGKIYHVVSEGTTHGPLLSIAGMEDFAFVPFNGKAFISPFKSYTINGLNVEKGLQNEFLYVYKGDGTAARKAAGSTPAGTLSIANGAAGHTDEGLHIFGVVGETDTGYLSAPIALASFTTSAALSVSFSSVPTFTGSQWTKRHIVASARITDFNGDLEGYDLFFIPDATINDNVTTTLSNVSFYDADLVEDASHLAENFTEIEAGTCLCFYHNRLVLGGQYDNQSLIYVSAPGEPEAINEVDGFLTMPFDGNPVYNVAEYRDVLYGFKRIKTASWVDNGDVPTSWPYASIDEGLGTHVHGIATRLDSGNASTDFLIIATYKGLMLFNGRFSEVELSQKIQDNWTDMEKDEFRRIQIIDDPVKQILYYVTTDRTIMCGNYQNGLNPKAIKWWPWSFLFLVNTIGMINIDDFIIGADQV